MAAPTREEGVGVSFGAHNVLSCILSVISPDESIRGEFHNVLHEIISGESNPLISRNFTFDRQYGYSPTLFSAQGHMVLGGTLVTSSNGTFSIRRQAYHKRVAREKFDGQQRKYLQGLGRRLI